MSEVKEYFLKSNSLACFVRRISVMDFLSILEKGCGSDILWINKGYLLQIFIRFNVDIYRQIIWRTQHTNLHTGRCVVLVLDPLLFRMLNYFIESWNISFFVAPLSCSWCVQSLGKPVYIISLADRCSNSAAVVWI